MPFLARRRNLFFWRLLNASRHGLFEVNKAHNETYCDACKKQRQMVKARPEAQGFVVGNGFE